MSNQHQSVVDEITGAAEIDVAGVDLSIPRDLEVQIAARQRQVLRNSAVLAQLNLRLARRRSASDEAKRFGQQLDQYVRDLAEIDRLYPEAKARMEQLDGASHDRTQEGP